MALLQAARLLLVAALHLDRLQQAAILRRQLELALVLERAYDDVLEGEEASGRLVLGRLEVVEYVARDDHVAILPRLYSAALLGQPPLAHRLDVVALGIGSGLGLGLGLGFAAAQGEGGYPRADEGLHAAPDEPAVTREEEEVRLPRLGSGLGLGVTVTVTVTVTGTVTVAGGDALPLRVSVSVRVRVRGRVRSRFLQGYG